MTISGRYRQRRIIFNGNSHFNLAQNSITQTYDYYVPVTIYNTIKSTYPCAMVAFAVGGNPTTTMNANFATQNAVVIQPGDIVVLWEITNDLSVNGLSGQQCYDQVVTFANSVKALGGKIIVGTTTARNHSGDAADIWTRGQACNTLIRNAPAGIFDAICDLGADPLFDSQADCDNATYYIDKLHFATAGQAHVISLWTTTITNYLASH
jgi:hypothetical protein